LLNEKPVQELLKMKTREKERERKPERKRERERERNAGLGHAVGLATMAGSRRDPTRVTA
jgi:hypothetical protein